MDVSLDNTKARSFNCSTCDSGLAKLRNCSGAGSAGKNIINGNLYRRCPKALWMEAKEARFLVELYMDCRESGNLPYPGSLVEQTHFTKEVFSILDNIVGEFRQKQNEKQMAEMKKRSNARSDV
jgi:hypothetical protein